MLIGVRSAAPRSFEADGFDELELGGLAAGDARRVLEHAAGAPVPDAVAQELCEATGGNPLALVELPELLDPEQLAGLAPVSEPLPPGSGVERSFSRRLDRLDPDARRALVVLAASSTRELAPAVAALGALASPLRRWSRLRKRVCSSWTASALPSGTRCYGRSSTTRPRFRSVVAPIGHWPTS